MPYDGTDGGDEAGGGPGVAQVELPRGDVEGAPVAGDADGATPGAFLDVQCRAEDVQPPVLKESWDLGLVGKMSELMPNDGPNDRKGESFKFAPKCKTGSPPPRGRPPSNVRKNASSPPPCGSASDLRRRRPIQGA